MQATFNNDQLLVDIAEVQSLTRLSRATIYRMMDERHKFFDKTFPKPIKIGPTVTLWRYEELRDWVKNLSARKE